ncbi:MAG: NADH-quinone oxidoreductase subunit NuoE [Propionibacteriaceae bacterium]|jgi:NADH-quinone oxidoreductase subunit E|nr:NADH-quinone oxidoreductase subunit NuoE [Propionibacteriaceae bacterium]
MSDHEFESFFPQSGSIDMQDQSSAIDQGVIDQLTAIAARYPQKRSALMPMLHLIQAVDGRVSPRGIAVCADLLDISEAQVSGVATFYTMYRRRPAGKHHIGVCTTALCAVMGGDALLERVEQKLGISAEQTTADGLFSLERIECNAACDFAPIMMVNWEFMDNMTPAKAEQLIDDLTAGRPVASTRGPQLTSWADSERVLAGFDDGQANAGPSAGPASLAGVQVAAQHGWTGVPGPISPTDIESAAAKPKAATPKAQPDSAPPKAAAAKPAPQPASVEAQQATPEPKAEVAQPTPEPTTAVPKARSAKSAKTPKEAK